MSAAGAECRPAAKLKLNELFVQWFNMPETQHVISLAVDEAARVHDDVVDMPSAGWSHLAVDVHRLHHLSLMGHDGRSPPASPTANGLSSLSLSSSPRTPPRSPEPSRVQQGLADVAASRTSAGLARGAEADVIAATVREAISPPPVPATATSPQRPTPGLAAADGAPTAAACGSSASPPGALGSPRGARASPRSGLRPGVPCALSPQKRSLSHSRGDDEAAESPPDGAGGRRAPEAERGGAAAAGAVDDAQAEGGGKKANLAPSVPPFYAPLGRLPPAARAEQLALVHAELEDARAGGPSVDHASALAVCTATVGLPAAVARVLLARLAREAARAAPADAMTDESAAIPAARLAAFVSERLLGFSLAGRVFHALLPEEQEAAAAAAQQQGGGGGAGEAVLTEAELRPLVRAVVDHHPGLAFLEATPEFQERYVETVALRILYSLARNARSVVTRAALERSALPAALAALDLEEDINASVAFFSYEHFYVLYCKFWELDDDHDMLLSRDDLARYADYALSSRAVERVYACATEGARAHAPALLGAPPGPLAADAAAPADGADGADGGAPIDADGGARMSYAHFVWFVLSEEDKSSRVALEYWFRRCDLDGDGFISGYEIDYFYSEQLHRMRCMGQEAVEVADIVCQLFDIVKPPEPHKGIALRDLLRCALGGKLFDVLLNLSKFLAWEAKDPHTIREERAQPRATDWERFCKREYLRLALEDEPPADGAEPMGWTDVAGLAGGGGGAGVMLLSPSGSLESPF